MKQNDLRNKEMKSTALPLHELILMRSFTVTMTHCRSQASLNKCTSNKLPSLINLPTCTFPVSFSQWCPSNATLSWECPYTSPNTHSLINVSPWIHYHANSPYNCYAPTAIHYACFKICSATFGTSVKIQRMCNGSALLQWCMAETWVLLLEKKTKKQSEQFSNHIAKSFSYVQYWKSRDINWYLADNSCETQLNVGFMHVAISL